MKFFLKEICIFAVLIIVPPIISIFLSRYYSKNIDWELPSQKHILFLGASHVAFDIDDSLMYSAINLANGNERYMFTYIKLQHLLKNNPQIDTIFLECAPTDLFEHADDKYFDDNSMVRYFATYYPLFNVDQWKMYKKKIPTAFSLLFRITVFDYIKGINYSFFSDKVINIDTLNRQSVYYNPYGGTYGNSINYEYLRKIIQLCKVKKVKLYFLYCPVYKPEFYYNQEYYYNSYKHNFSDIELLDYSHFPMDDHERNDAHHLNKIGAKKFTTELKKRFKIK